MLLWIVRAYEIEGGEVKIFCWSGSLCAKRLVLGEIVCVEYFAKY